MYNSGITALELMNSVKKEADISYPISDETLLRTINTVEQFIYTEILKEHVKQEFANLSSDVQFAIELAEINVPEGVSLPIFDDIIHVFANEDEVERSGISGVFNFPDKNLYYNNYDGKITLSLCESPDIVTIIYRLRPALKTANNANSAIIALPVEFVELIAAKMRGEMYKIANEDGLSAKWLSEYNVQLENFKVWAAERMTRYGG